MNKVEGKISLHSLSIEVLTVLKLTICYPKKTVTSHDSITGFPAKWPLSNECRNSILMMYHYPDLDSASVASDLMVEANFQPIRSTTQTWGVTIYQYGISALVSQTSFCQETSGGVTKCWLQFLANKNWFHHKTASEKWESQNVDCDLRLTIGVEKGVWKMTT